MHNIDKPWSIIVMVSRMTFKIVFRYIFVWWKPWLHINLEIYKFRRVRNPLAGPTALKAIPDWQHDIVYHLWYDVTPFKFFLLFIFSIVAIFIYTLWNDSYKRQRFFAFLKKYRPRRWRCEFLQFKQRFYIKHLRYWYVIYTAYRYNFFDNIARLRHYVISLFYKIKLTWIKFKKFFKLKK